MTHAEMDDLYELFVLGALEPEAAAEIRQHLDDRCEYCLSHVQEALLVSAGLSALADPQQPPRELRERILASVKREKPKRSWHLAIGALGVACAALLALALWSQSRVQSYQQRVTDLEGQRDQLRAAVEILSQSQTRTVQFGLADNKPHGRVFVNPQRGLVFVGSQLPELANDRTFELWLVPAQGAPQPVTVFRPNTTGNFVAVRNTPVDTARMQAVAVSVEPLGGSPAPTTTPILVVPLGSA
jgi:anti-sigma-K factor RskA